MIVNLFFFCSQKLYKIYLRRSMVLDPNMSLLGIIKNIIIGIVEQMLIYDYYNHRNFNTHAHTIAVVTH